MDQLQEGRRAGRNGEPAHVIIIYHGRQLSHCNSDVKEFINTNGCYRVAAYCPFDSMVKPGSIKLIVAIFVASHPYVVRMDALFYMILKRNAQGQLHLFKVT